MFDKAKDIGLPKVTDMTLNGESIVLGKKRGRPPVFKKKKPDWVPLETRCQAAIQFAVLGNVEKVAELVDLPPGTIRKFMQEEWWHELVGQVRREENESLSGKMTVVVDKALDQMVDRLENGDYVLTRAGELKRIPVKLRDLAFPANLMVEKRQLLRGEATSRTERLDTNDRLDELAKRFKKFAQSKEVDGVVVEKIEEKADGESTEL